MAHLIDKDALVAEIKKRIKYYQAKNQKWGVAGYAGRVAEGEEILSYINTLEVKEVDLEKELKNARTTLLDDAFGSINGEKSLAIRNFARHFYELGLKTQNCNNDKCKDLKDDGICNYASTKLGKIVHCENISCSRRK